MRLRGVHISDKSEKKYYAELETDRGTTKKVYFGQAGAKDYTSHSSLDREKRKAAYIKRHSATEDWNNPESAGFWSRWVLWGKTPSISKNILDVKHRFHL